MAAIAQPGVETRWYRMCGLTLASCLDVPGAAEVDPPGEAADAVVRFGCVPEHLSDATWRGPTWEAGPGRVLLRVPGGARFLIQDGREIWLDPADRRDPRELAIFLTGSVLGALLHQRGCFVLHASAVAVDGRAVAFCGPSGSGKSVLVAALSAAGYPLVTDEVCCVRADGDDATVSPDGRQLRLWADTVAGLALEERKGAIVRAGIEKYWVDPRARSAGGLLPLRAVYFLHPAQLPNATRIETAKFLDAVAMLRANAYRRRLIKALGREQAWLNACVSIARRAEACHLTRELKFDALPGCVRMLEEHWKR